MSAPLTAADLGWFAAHAGALDRGAEHAEQVVPELGRRELLRIGVPAALGGAGGDTYDAVEAIAAVAERSLTAAFVFWGQRTFIEFLLHTPQDAARERWLPALLKGSFAGATGLSNAMKFLSGIEALQVRATPENEGWRLDGNLPWVTNLRRSGFVVAAAVSTEDGPPAVVALVDSQPGVVRSEDLDLLALRGSNTAAVAIDGARVGAEQILHRDARQFCPRVRPAFLGLQLGLSLGLARVALRSAGAQAQGAHGAIAPEIEALSGALETCARELRDGLTEARFINEPAALFRLRIRLAEIVQRALDLELQATGGRAYLNTHNAEFARRWLEAAFIPVITPSLSQLRGELAKLGSASCTGAR